MSELPTREEDLKFLAEAVQKHLADGPASYESNYGDVTWACCSADADKPHDEDCTWFRLLLAYERYLHPVLKVDS